MVMQDTNSSEVITHVKESHKARKLSHSLSAKATIVTLPNSWSNKNDTKLRGFVSKKDEERLEKIKKKYLYYHTPSVQAYHQTVSPDNFRRSNSEVKSQAICKS
jgi:hypothetical protein